MKRNQRGRPRLPENKRARNLVSLRLTDAEARQLQKRAIASGLKMSTYIRSLVFREELA